MRSKIETQSNKLPVGHIAFRIFATANFQILFERYHQKDFRPINGYINEDDYKRNLKDYHVDLRTTVFWLTADNPEIDLVDLSPELAIDLLNQSLTRKEKAYHTDSLALINRQTEVAWSQFIKLIQFYNKITPRENQLSLPGPFLLIGEPKYRSRQYLNNLDVAVKIHEAFESWIYDYSDFNLLTMTELYFLLEFCLVTYSGIKDVKKRQLILSAIQSPDFHIRQFKSNFWISIQDLNFALESETTEVPVLAPGFHRWFPDPYSLLILQNILICKNKNDTNTTEWRRTLVGIISTSAHVDHIDSLNKFIMQQKKDRADLFLAKMFVAWDIKTQPLNFISEYQIGRIKSVNLSEELFIRNLQDVEIRKFKPLGLTAKISESDQISKINVISQVNVYDIDYSEIRSAVNSGIDEQQKTQNPVKSKAALNELLHRNKDASLSSIWFIHYLLHLLKHGNVKSSLKLSTVKNYMVIAKKWLEITQNTPIERLDEDEWEDLYDTINSIIKENNLNLVRYFFEYLILKKSIPLSHDYLLHESDEQGQSTRAHYVNVIQYQSLLTKISELSGISKYRQLQYQILVILMYRLGLRISEALTIQYRQVNTFAKTVSISRSKHRTLKSKHANRRIQYHLLLDKNELELFETFINHTKTVSESYVFSVSATNSLLLNMHDFRETVSVLLKGACNNSEIVFHSLRHSCVNNIVLACMHAEGHQLPFPQAWSADQMNDIRDFYCSSKEPLQKIFFNIQQTIGHASAETTIRHYFHLMDWVESAFRNKTIINRSNRSIESTFGIAESSLRSKKGSDNVRYHHVVELLAKKFLKSNQLIRLNKLRVKSSNTYRLLDINDLDLSFKIQRFIYAESLIFDNVSVDAITRKLANSSGEFEVWKNQIIIWKEQINAIKTASRKYDGRFGFTRAVNLRVTSKRRLARPIPNKQALEKYYERYVEIIQNSIKKNNISYETICILIRCGSFEYSNIIVDQRALPWNSNSWKKTKKDIKNLIQSMPKNRALESKFKIKKKTVEAPENTPWKQLIISPRKSVYTEEWKVFQYILFYVMFTMNKPD